MGEDVAVVVPGGDQERGVGGAHEVLLLLLLLERVCLV